MRTAFQETHLRDFENDTSADEKDAAPATAEPPLWRRYTVVGICVLVAFAIRYFLSSLLGEELPFMLFIAAALVASWYGGAVAGAASLLMGLLLADFVFLAPAKQNISHSAALFYLFRYVFTASLGIVLIEVLHRSRRNLAHEVDRRKRSEAALRLAQAEVKQHADELERRVEQRTLELQAAVQSLQGLLYHIAHNFRAPLRAMEGYTTILMDEYASRLDSRAQEYSRHISDAAQRMDELIHDLLDYGRLGHAKIRLDTVPLEAVVEKVLYRLAYEVRRKNADVFVRHPLPEVCADRELLEQVLTNLVENALKFVAPDLQPHVEIRADRREHKIRIWVEDNGLGISSQYFQRIFRAFETLGVREGGNGTGIGLAIVKEGARRMRGEAGVESTVGKGSRFWLDLLAPSPGVTQQ